jgi:hypothetical protein
MYRAKRSTGRRSSGVFVFSAAKRPAGNASAAKNIRHDLMEWFMVNS